MTVEVRPLGVHCNIQCNYCYQNLSLPKTSSAPRMAVSGHFLPTVPQLHLRVYGTCE